jgi:K+-sensing histidine kinase KdpD
VRNSLKTYALGLAAVVIAVLLRWALDPLMGDALPLVTVFGAVAAAVWLGGYSVAIPVALVGCLACHYLFIPPRGHFDIVDVSNQVGLVAYLLTCSLIIVIHGSERADFAYRQARGRRGAGFGEGRRRRNTGRQVGQHF